MNIEIAALTKDSQKEAIDIFNYYVENSFAAYPEQKLPYEFFDHFLKCVKGIQRLLRETNRETY
jgi:phosphinothricin acetyltransferase